MYALLLRYGSVLQSVDIHGLYVCMVITYKGKDQPRKVVNLARDQLKRENYLFLSPFAPENLVS